MSNHKIRRYKKSEVNKVTHTIVAAFRDDPFLRWLCGGSAHYERIAVDLVKTWVRYAHFYGLGLQYGDAQSVVLMKHPGDTRFSWWRLLRTGMIRSSALLGRAGIQRLALAERLTQHHRDQQGGVPLFAYCWVLATAPQAQNKGMGTQLMKAVIQCYSRVPVCLETQSESNALFYQRFGFFEHYRFELEGADFPYIGLIRPA